ncbi:MAG: hypothetical protein SOU50_05185 [Oscillospiraceae bacterium]|nr:hypothetical protein [Oscillospiraceae bacterium]MDD7428214.1 hypothetical protein [Oscillospiraceae bacterium]MDY2847597.1 hypothetical protein [Oscillospiraceae bacterium]
MKKYTIIAGVNGVGKSSMTGLLVDSDYELGVIIDTDMITSELGGDRIKGGKEAIRLINDCIARGISFTQETTLSGKRTIKTINNARENNYYICMYYVGVSSSEESIARIANRVRKGGHNIPAEDVIRRYAHRIDDLLRVMSYCNEIFFYDNENGFVRVGEYHNGKLYDAGRYMPQWYIEIKNALMFNGKDR